MAVPTNNEDLCYTPAVELAQLIRDKQLSSVEVIDAFIERIETVNPKLNAYVTVHHDKSRAAAKKADEAVQRGDDLGPLHGVPVSIKDLAWTEGVRTTCGSNVYENFIPDENAPIVERFLDAGAISLGKTNTPEFGWLAITDNEVFGRTNNPWNLECTPSGSSGGAGAAQAAGLCAIAHGSDGGGSIRHPAAFCGLFGIKPTFGMVPKHALQDGWPSISHNGPLTRTVADGALALDVLTGYDPRDMYSAPLPPQNFLENLNRDLKGLRVAWSVDMGFAEVDPRVREKFLNALPAFKEFGCSVQEGVPDLTEAREIFKGVQFVEAVGGDLKYVEADGSSKMSDDLTRFIVNRKDIPARDYMAALENRRKMYAGVCDFFEDVDILVTPTMAIPAFEHPKTMRDYPHEVNGVEVGATGWHPFTYPFNLTGQPAATVPCGFTDEGLPVGLQIVGRRFEDLLVMQVAAAFEKARPWAHLRPSV